MNFIEEQSGDTLWPLVDKALKEKRLVYIRSPLLKRLNPPLGCLHKNKFWLPAASTPAWWKRWQRCRDIIFSFLALVVLGPLFLVVALLVKISSPGPIFYKSSVIGKHGRKFIWRKFRSMRVVSVKEDREEWLVRFRAHVEGLNTHEKRRFNKSTDFWRRGLARKNLWPGAVKI